MLISNKCYHHLQDGQHVRPSPYWISRWISLKRFGRFIHYLISQLDCSTLQNDRALFQKPSNYLDLETLIQFFIVFTSQIHAHNFRPNNFCHSLSCFGDIFTSCKWTLLQSWYPPQLDSRQAGTFYYGQAKRYDLSKMGPLNFS